MVHSTTENYAHKWRLYQQMLHRNAPALPALLRIIKPISPPPTKEARRV